MPLVANCEGRPHLKALGGAPVRLGVMGASDRIAHDACSASDTVVEHRGMEGGDFGHDELRPILKYRLRTYSSLFGDVLLDGVL